MESSILRRCDRRPDSVAAAVKGAAAVVNLVGILQEGGRQSFAGVQANGARAIAQACAAAGIARLGQVTAIGGDTVAALNPAGVADDFTYVSTAGGAFLEGVEGKELPGVEVLK
eukprot:gene4267-5813_t